MTAEPYDQNLEEDVDWEALNREGLTQLFQAFQKALTLLNEGNAEADPAALIEETAARLLAEQLLPNCAFLADVFDLNDFDQFVLLLLLASEVDSQVADLCRDVQGLARGAHPVTVGLCLILHTGGDYDDFLDGARLRAYGLVSLGEDTLYRSVVTLDPAIRHFLLTGAFHDEAFQQVTAPLPEAHSMPESHVTVAQCLQAAWSFDQGGEAAIQLCGTDRENSLSLLSQVAQAAGAVGALIEKKHIPQDGEDLAEFTMRLNRWLAFFEGLLVIDCISADAGELNEASELRMLLRNCRGKIVVLVKERISLSGGPVFFLDRPKAEEQKELWLQLIQEEYGLICQACNVVDGAQNGALLHKMAGDLAAAFDFAVSDLLKVRQVLRASVRAWYQAEQKTPITATGQFVLPWEAMWWQAAKDQARPALSGLARRIEPSVGLEGLVLAEASKANINRIVSEVKTRSIVQGQWGLTSANGRGQGITVLFAGPSGTGKTLAAGTIAKALELDLYQIDLSTLISKYIGETQKNLSKVFEAAEKGGGVLLFDEADALFGKRSEVKDSRDRSANMEVAYLLQRMEEYRGVAILTSNLKDQLDDAFKRRLRYIIDFPFPDLESRAELWRVALRAVPGAEALNIPGLSKASLSGAQIQNVVTVSAHLAVAAGRDHVALEDLASAMAMELDKVGRSMRPADLQQMLTTP